MYFVPETAIYPRKRPVYITAVLVSAAVITAIARPDIINFAFTMSVAALVFYGVLVYTLSKKKTLVNNDGILQEHAFGRKSFLRWTDINAVKMEWEFDGHGASPKVVIAGGSKNLLIQHTSYKRKDLQWLFQTISAKLPGIEISPKIMQMAEGHFPWYI
jgi:hypothetical protein